jgi:LPS O-antigen subunit length determinant protein (WzzB/FepE family)
MGARYGSPVRRLCSAIGLLGGALFGLLFAALYNDVATESASRTLRPGPIAILGALLGLVLGLFVARLIRKRRQRTSHEGPASA